MKTTERAVLATLGVLTFSASALWAQPSAVHEGPRYVEAADLTYGPTIAKARTILHARMDEFPGFP